MTFGEGFAIFCVFAIIVGYFGANAVTTLQHTLPGTRNWKNWLLPPWFWDN
jgi:hypothetical protein